MNRLNTMILYIFIGGLMVFFFGKCLLWVSFYGLKPILTSYLLWRITVNKRRYNLQLKKLSRKNEMYSYKYVIIIFFTRRCTISHADQHGVVSTARHWLSHGKAWHVLWWRVRYFTKIVLKQLFINRFDFFSMPLFCCKLHRTSLQTREISNYLAIFFIFIQLNSHVKWSVFQNPGNFC